MRKILIVLVVALAAGMMASTAHAEEGRIPDATLAALGLGAANPVSDARGNEIRGEFFGNGNGLIQSHIHAIQGLLEGHVSSLGGLIEGHVSYARWLIDIHIPRMQNGRPGLPNF